MEKLRGLAWVFGDNIDTDQIIPAKFCNTFNPDELVDHAMEGIGKEFPHRVAPGDFIIAGRNFGCGSSREAAPLALKATGISAIVATSFSRLFFRNAVNIGLYIMVCPAAAENIQNGEELVIDRQARTIQSLSTGRAYKCEALPGFIQEIVDSGGMVEWTKRKLAKAK